MCGQRRKTQVSNVDNVCCRHVRTYKASGIVEAIFSVLIVILMVCYVSVLSCDHVHMHM